MVRFFKGALPFLFAAMFTFSAMCAAEDTYEENDTKSASSDLTALLDVSGGSVDGLYAAPLDDDWFKFTVSEQALITLNCLFSLRNDGNDDSDLEMALYSADGSLIEASESGTDNERIVYLASAGEELFVKVWGCDNSPWGAAGPSWNSYSLQIISDDRFEVNDTQATAADLAGETLVQNLYLSAQNIDWFKFTVSDPALITLNCLFSLRNDGNLDSDLEMALYRADGSQIAVSETGTANESITYLATTGEVLYIKVWGYDNSQWGGAGPSWNDYSLEVVLAPYFEDRFEVNDSMATAADMTGETLVDELYVNTQNVDWFKYTVAVDAQLTVDCIFQERNDDLDDSDLDIAMYDESGALLDYSVSGNDNERVVAVVHAGGTLFIKVEGADNTPYGAVGPSYNDYVLQFSVAELIPDPMGDLTGVNIEFTSTELSRTSPAWVAGNVGNGASAIMVSVNNSAPFAATKDQNGKWFASNSAPFGIALNESSAVSLEVISSSNSSTQTIQQTLSWITTTVGDSDLSELSIRKGASLRLVAFDANQAADAVLEIDLNDDGLADLSGLNGQAIVHTFFDSGAYEISAKVGLVDMGSMTVHVISVDWNGPTACEIGYQREKTVAVSPVGGKVAFTSNTPFAWAVEANGGANVNVPALLVSGVEESKLQARVGTVNGAIVAEQAIDTFTISTTAKQYIGVVDEYEDGSVLLEAELLMTPKIPGLTVKVLLLAGGLTFADSTLELEVSSDDFVVGEDGVARLSYQIIMASDASYGPCHTIKVEQNGVQINEVY